MLALLAAEPGSVDCSGGVPARKVGSVSSNGATEWIEPVTGT